MPALRRLHTSHPTNRVLSVQGSKFEVQGSKFFASPTLIHQSNNPPIHFVALLPAPTTPHLIHSPSPAYQEFPIPNRTDPPVYEGPCARHLNPDHNHDLNLAIRLRPQSLDCGP